MFCRGDCCWQCSLEDGLMASSGVERTHAPRRNSSPTYPAKRKASECPARDMHQNVQNGIVCWCPHPGLAQ